MTTSYLNEKDIKVNAVVNIMVFISRCFILNDIHGTGLFYTPFMLP